MSSVSPPPPSSSGGTPPLQAMEPPSSDLSHGDKYDHLMHHLQAATMVPIPWHTLHEQIFQVSCLALLIRIQNGRHVAQCTRCHIYPHPHSEEVNILHFCFSNMERHLLDRSFSSSHLSRMCLNSPSTSSFYVLVSPSASWSFRACFSAVFTTTNSEPQRATPNAFAPHGWP